MPGGRPTNYRPEYVEQVLKYALLGLKDSEIAPLFDISEATLNNWKNEYPEFLESIKEGREKADANVAKSLYHRAKGYMVKEVTYEKIENKKEAEEGMEVTDEGELEIDPDTNEMYKKKVVVKEVVPDVWAQRFWLMNRHRDKWTERSEVKTTGEVHVTYGNQPGNEPIKE